MLRLNFTGLSDAEKGVFRNGVQIEHGVQAKCRRCKKVREVLKTIQQ